MAERQRPGDEQFIIIPHRRLPDDVRAALDANPFGASAERDAAAGSRTERDWNEVRAGRYRIEHIYVARLANGVSEIIQETIRLEAPDAVVAVPYRWNKLLGRYEFFTVLQSRPLTQHKADRPPLSFPMGHKDMERDEPETDEAAAIREIFEETEMSSIVHVEKIGEMDRDPSITDAQVTVWAIEVAYERTVTKSAVQDEEENVYANDWRSWEDFYNLIKTYPPRNPWALSAFTLTNFWYQKKMEEMHKRHKHRLMRRVKIVGSFLAHPISGVPKDLLQEEDER